MNKLGITVTDPVTGITGKLTHLSVRRGGRTMVLIRPNALNPDNKEPADSFWVDTEQIPDLDVASLTNDMPLNAIGTVATEPSLNYSGTIIQLTLHLNGCVHAIVQMSGQDNKTGTRYKPQNFDIRELEGVALPKLTEQQESDSRKSKPSPAPFKSHSPGQ